MATNTSPEKLQKAKQYEKIHNILFVAELIISFAVLLIFIFSGLSQWLVDFIAPLSVNIWFKVFLYVLICYVSFSLIFFPLSFYSGYLLEHKFDLSNETKKMWFLDYAKSLGINILFLLIFAEVLHLFLRISGNMWWIWAGMFWLLFGLVISNLYPILILPIFYKVKPLENEDLVERLMKLSESVKAKILGVFEMDMSRKSKKANAMFAGLGNTKRIILSDTLVSD